MGANPEPQSERRDDWLELYVHSHVDHLAVSIANYLMEENPMMTRRVALKMAYRHIGSAVAKGLAPPQ